MYLAKVKNKIIAVNDSNDFSYLIYDSLEEDTTHNVGDFIHIDGEFVLKTNEKAIAHQKEQIRAVREQYFSDYVDWYQSKPLLWKEMTEEEKRDIADYRKYLMDYTKEENWWEKNPQKFEEFIDN